MGMSTIMSTAISGLNANGEMLSSISDNISNANTNGFKTSRTEFQSALAIDLSNINQSGANGTGVAVAGVTTLFQQGPIIRTDRNTDMAINGNGFFVVNTDQGRSFTRDGNFHFDKDGWLTTLNGNKIQAFQPTPEGKIGGTLGDLRIPVEAAPAKATNNIEVFVNLDAREDSGKRFDLKTPDETSQFTTAIQLYDSVGNARSINLFFNRTEGNGWSWTAMTDGENLVGGKKGTLLEVAQGMLNFDENGKLVNSQQSLINTNFSGAIANQDIKFNFGDPISEGGTGQKGSTQFGSKSSLLRSTQDGWSSGNLIDTMIDSDGLVTGIYSNGQHKILAQIASATFENTEGLAKVGNNMFKDTIQSGFAEIGMPKSSGRGSIVSRSLEQSNVDVAKEFVDMIRAQRAFQASAKAITTANELMGEVIQIKAT